jgi:hypothetical protein
MDEDDSLFAWQNVPARAFPLHALRATANGAWAAYRVDRGRHAVPVFRGLIRSWREIRASERHPLDYPIYRLSIELRRQGPMPLELARSRIAAAGRGRGFNEGDKTAWGSASKESARCAPLRSARRP